ncbi:MAG: hypothetical protein H6839_13160 [Planctomycetes bacterium]|nr:hypothetical protein [Planctomycetota bacterium]
MDENFRTVQRALETGSDVLFEVARQRLPEELAETVEATRRQLAEAQTALVRLEAELIRAREEHKEWMPLERDLPLTRTTRA